MKIDSKCRTEIFVYWGSDVKRWLPKYDHTHTHDVISQKMFSIDLASLFRLI